MWCDAPKKEEGLIFNLNFNSESTSGSGKSSSGQAIFPEGCPVFEDSLKSRHQICFDFKGKRGCYLWTHKETGKQYIGSSRNLSLRLGDYYRKGYLKLQSERGSIICRALIKYGHASFSLSIMVMGSLPGKDSNYSSTNIPDFVIMEQSYLDNYKFEYNVNRVASSKYISTSSSINEGVNNPSYNLKGEKAFVWNRTHSEELKTLWSESRGKIIIYVYSIKTLELLNKIPSRIKLASYLNINLSLVEQIVASIKSSKYSAVIYKDYIISVIAINSGSLSVNLKYFPVNVCVINKGKRNITIYGFNPSLNEYRTWSSKGDCLEELTSNRYTNIRTINKRIDNNILYMGYYLQTKPFK